MRQQQRTCKEVKVGAVCEGTYRLYIKPDQVGKISEHCGYFSQSVTEQVQCLQLGEFSK